MGAVGHQTAEHFEATAWLLAQLRPHGKYVYLVIPLKPSPGPLPFGYPPLHNSIWLFRKPSSGRLNSQDSSPRCCLMVAIATLKTSQWALPVVNGAMGSVHVVEILEPVSFRLVLCSSRRPMLIDTARTLQVSSPGAALA